MSEKLVGRAVTAANVHGDEMVVAAFCNDKITFMPHDEIVTIGIDKFMDLLNELYINKQFEVTNEFAGVIN